MSRQLGRGGRPGKKKESANVEARAKAGQPFSQCAYFVRPQQKLDEEMCHGETPIITPDQRVSWSPSHFRFRIARFGRSSRISGNHPKILHVSAGKPETVLFYAYDARAIPRSVAHASGIDVALQDGYARRAHEESTNSQRRRKVAAREIVST